MYQMTKPQFQGPRNNSVLREKMAAQSMAAAHQRMQSMLPQRQVAAGPPLYTPPVPTPQGPQVPGLPNLPPPPDMINASPGGAPPVPGYQVPPPAPYTSPFGSPVQAPDTWDTMLQYFRRLYGGGR